MISYNTYTPSKTLEERIVDIANSNSSNQNAEKILAIDVQNHIHYKILPPIIKYQIITGIFSSATTNETIIVSLAPNVIFEDILNINFSAYYNTSSNSYYNAGVCWSGDSDSVVTFYSNSINSNPSINNQMRIYRRTSRMANAPYKIIISYI